MNDTAYKANAGEIRQFVERAERLDAEKAELTEQRKEVMAQAKSRGYDVKALNAIIARRKKTPDQLAEEAAILDMYSAALGM